MTNTPSEDTDAGAGDIYAGGIYTRRRRKTVRMREDGWRDACRKLGISSDNVLGSVLSYNPSHVYRVRLGQSTPGTDFIATAMAVFECEFEQLFEVVDRDENTPENEEEQHPTPAALGSPV